MDDAKVPHFDRDLHKTNPADLARLLSLDAGLPWSDDDLAAILRHQLQMHLAADLGEKVQGASADELQQTFEQLLMSPLPSLPLLRAAKKFAKANRKDAGGWLPAEVATVLYYAAIVAARLRWRARISELSQPDLLCGIDWTLSRPWLAPALSPLFHEARSVLGASQIDPR